jgi:hypothetical protein
MSKTRDISIELTSRGKKAVGFLVIVLLVSILFRDPILIATSGLLLFYVFMQYSVLKSKLDTIGGTLKTERIEGTVVAGEFYKDSLVFKDEFKDVVFESPFDNGVFSPSDVEGEYLFIFQPMLAGNYSSKGFIFEVRNRYDLCVGRGSLPVEFEVNVYPRVFPEAVRVMEYLLGGGAAYQGDVPYRLRGGGLEYAESRMYQPGDPLKSFDWKAMARTLEPIVKQYYAEGGGGLLLAAELDAPDPVSADQLSAEFLRMVSSLVSAEYQFKLAILEDNTLHGYVDEQPEYLLRMALRYALGDHVKAFKAYYMLLDPFSEESVNKILSYTERDYSKEILYNDLLQSASSSEIHCILISPLTGNPKNLLELLDKLRGIRYSIRYLDSTKPWLHALSLKEAYTMWEQRRKISQILYEYGTQIVVPT